MKKNRKVLLLVSSFCFLSGCSQIAPIEAPSFESEEKVTFTAYAGPTVGSWNGVDSNPNTLTEEHYKKLKEAGFDRVIALYEGAGARESDVISTAKNQAKKAEKDASVALSLAEKYGLSYYVRDWSFYGLSQPSGYFYQKGIQDASKVEELMPYIFNDDNAYIHSSAYAGNFCYDEPTYDELPNVSWEVDAYLKRMEELGAKGEPLVNLLPVYASSFASMGTHSYSEYLDRYIELIGKKIGYLSYDFYPFLNYDGSYLRGQYLQNLQLAALKCRQNNLELRSFIQAKGDFTGLRDLTSIADFRFQIYSSLAFGSNHLTYYEYAGSNGADEGEFSLFNFQKGEYNYTYDLAKKVNNEIHHFENVLTSFEYENVLFRNANPLYDNQNFANLIEKIDTHPNASIKNASEDTLLTTFKHKKNESNAFMLVNFTDPYQNKSNEVTLRFPNASALLMYRFGEKMTVRLPASHEYTFQLLPGEGRFIIPF